MTNYASPWTEPIAQTQRRQGFYQAVLAVIMGVTITWQGFRVASGAEEIAAACVVLGLVLVPALGSILAIRAYRALTGVHQSHCDLLDALLQTVRAQSEELEVRVTDRTKDLVDQARLLECATDEAEEASRAKSMFLANMSHELRTPLNAIIGYSEILQDEAGDLGCEAIVPDLQKIQSAGKHLLALINDILDLSKIEAGKMELFLEPLDVPSIIAEVANTIAPQAAKRGNKLDSRIDPALPTLVADGTKLRQSLFNLMSNACKFTENGQITLDVFPETIGDASWVTFAVSDTGIGIAPEAMSKLFRDFSQADASTTRKYGGTGLGLAISQRFCELLGGHISVESELGRGARFALRLPAEPLEDLGTAAPGPARNAMR